MDLPELVATKLDGLPLSPGVYIFKDKESRIVYVGKAKNLRSRVRSYFLQGSSDTRYFIGLLGRTLGDVDTIVTSTEKEAAILENSLIKEHQPRFNVKLRDDKNFLSIRLAESEKWARLYLVRSAANDGARYFGPYHSATSARKTLSVINKHFQLRTCTDSDMKARKRPCLQYQIKRCPGPCVFEVDEKFYKEQVTAVGLFLSGRHDELSSLLESRMAQAASTMRFEMAAIFRDQLRAIRNVQEAQRVVMPDRVDRDVIGIHREGDLAEVSLLHVRSGIMADVVTWTIRDAATVDEEIVGAFVSHHYGNVDAQGLLPAEILIPTDLDCLEGVTELISEQAGRRVEIIRPQRGKKLELVALANDNAKHAFDEKRRSRVDLELRIEQLRERLRLKELPLRIECCDISHLGGKDCVGAIVAMKGGLLDKKRYRTFHVQTARESDDYGAMYEVLARRFRRARDEEGWEAPDLFVVDGGKGQLNVALAAAKDLGLHDLAIVALAKEKESALGEQLVDRIYLPGQKNAIAVRSSAALLLLAHLRDEAHRFSNKARSSLGMKRRFSSELDIIRGIGPKTKKALLGALGSAEKIFAASDDELLAIPGVNVAHLRALRAHAR